MPELCQRTVKLEVQTQSLGLRGVRLDNQLWTVPLSNSVLASPGKQLVRHFCHIPRTARSMKATGSSAEPQASTLSDVSTVLCVVPVSRVWLDL